MSVSCLAWPPPRLLRRSPWSPGRRPALADRAPPQDAMPLSPVLQALEQQGQVARFKEVEWDGDGYWEIEYVLRCGGTAEVKVDPVSGQPRK